jgi:hypothetical protein
MKKKNDKTDKTVVEQPSAGVQTIQEGSGNSDSAPSTPEQSEGSEKELQVQSEQGSGEQTDDEGNPGVDSESKETAVIQERSGTGDRVTDIDRKRNRIAGDVFEKNAQCQTLYFTADLIPFFVKSDAVRHGTGMLKNETIVTINRK